MHRRNGKDRARSQRRLHQKVVLKQVKRLLARQDCPEATQDIAVNLANRQNAIDTANYGPLDPSLPNEKYWTAKAEMFNTTIENAKNALCGNCAFFDIRSSMLGCMAEGIDSETDADAYDVIDAGQLGYCEAFDFKCSAERTCDAWVVGGPITDETQRRTKTSTPNENSMETSLAQRINDLLAKRQEEATNFPQAGDDEKVSLRNSQYNLFPVEYAQDIKNNYLSVWREGGNIRGNSQFELLAPIARRGGNVETLAEENAVRRREAWAARHFEDYSLAGVVAQMKWLVIGSRGLDHMKSAIQDAKDKLDNGEKLFENPCWSGYVAYGLKPNGDPLCVPEKTADKIERLLFKDC